MSGISWVGVSYWIGAIALVGLLLYVYFRLRKAADQQSIPDGASSLAAAAAEFLAQKRFAVAGVSRAGNAPANLIFKKLKDSGRDVYAINPNAESVEGARCYASIADIPEAPDAVMIATHPDRAIEIAHQCKTAGVRHVWFHRSIDGGSYSADAAALCAGYGAMVIPGSCPMMHLAPVDIAHRCMRGVLSLTRKLPNAVETPKI